MNYGLILAGGVGQRMRSSGMPKQFLEVFQKPIIIYTLEKFDACDQIDAMVVACNSSWIDYLNQLLLKHSFRKPVYVTAGGKDRQSSVLNGMRAIMELGADKDAVVVIHDAVRPLVEPAIIAENIKVSIRSGCCMTVRPVVETVVITNKGAAGFENMKKRDDTYSLTSPQTFKLSLLQGVYDHLVSNDSKIPLLDPAMAYAYQGNQIPLVIENGKNIKVTTPEDYYVLKAILELEENRAVFGLQ